MSSLQFVDVNSVAELPIERRTPMAIEMNSLFSAAPGLPLNGGAEVYIAEFHNVVADEGVGAEPEDIGFKALTVLVNFSSNDADRAAMAPLLHALKYARSSVAIYAGTEWPKRLAERLSANDPDFLAVAIYVGSQTGVVAERIQAAISTLHSEFGPALAVVTMVSDADARWSDLAGVSGFVRGVLSTDGETARQVFLMLSSLMQPKTLDCIDVVDFLPLLGTAAAPALLCEAFWLRDQGGRLVYLTGEDERVVRGAHQVGAIAFVQGFTLGELGLVCRALRADIENAGNNCNFFAPREALTPGLLPSRAGWVPLLCRTG